MLESNLDPGRGPVVTALVEEGTLRVGDPIVAGGAWGRVRAMFDEHGQQVAEAGPSVPVEVLGLDDVPLAGDELRVAPDDKIARTVAEARAHRRKAASLQAPDEARAAAPGSKTSSRWCSAARSPRSTSSSKADVQGSLEALTDALRKLDQKHDEVRLSFVHRGVGGITESDVNLAAVSNATVIGFNVRPDRKARELAEREGVEMRLYEVIYHVLEDVQQRARSACSSPSSKRSSPAKPRCARCSRCRVSARSPVATCAAASSPAARRSGSSARASSSGRARSPSLRRFKDDVREVRDGFECGIGLENYQDLKQGDVIETYDMREIARV